MAAIQAQRPPEPAYIFRGHAAAVNALCFLPSNLRLLSGDADGFVILWNLSIRRAVAVWKAHEAGVIALGMWGAGRILTQGRDGKLRVWSLGPSDEAKTDFSTALPIEDGNVERKAPWLLFEVKVETVNFCGFASYVLPAHATVSNDEDARLCAAHNGTVLNASKPKHLQSAPLYEEQQDQSTAGSDEATSQQAPTQDQLLLALPGSKDSEITLLTLPSQQTIGIITAPKAEGTAQAGMVMALRIFTLPDATHTAPATSPSIIVIAGYENGQVTVFTQVKTPGEKGAWSQVYTARPHAQPVLSLDVAPTRDTFYSCAADANIAKHYIPHSNQSSASGTKQIKVSGTKHAGQQGLCVRSDGKIFATAGWDKMVRVYSAKTLTELAVLAWHKIGCYAVAFANVLGEDIRDGSVGDVKGGGGTAVVRGTVAQAREEKTQKTHWLAAGAKDGKISLWDIY